MLAACGYSPANPEATRRLSATPVEANRALTALSTVYGWADRAQLVPSGTNPTRHVERFAERGSRRAFTAAELQALGKALHEAEAAETEHPLSPAPLNSPQLDAKSPPLP